MERKEIVEMTDRELMMELVADSRRRRIMRDVTTVIRLIMVAVLIWFCMIYVPRILAVAEKYALMIEDIQLSISQLKAYVDKIPFDEEEFKTTVETIKTLTEQLNKLLNIFR